MHEVILPVVGSAAAWRDEARALARAGIRAEDVVWRVGQSASHLFAGAAPVPGPGREIRLPRSALATIDTALHHSDPERFARAYAAVLRLSDGRARWGDRSDPMIRRILTDAKAVGRDIHKMHAFVRFRELPSDGPRRAFGAWFEPDHPIVEAASPFFAGRFGDMDWVIATPTLTARFDAGRLSFSATPPDQRPPEDATEDLWRAYYASIFNPARLMVSAMQSEMPRKYWKNLPEAALIPDLIREAPRRAAQMQAAMPTEPPARRAMVARAMAQREAVEPPPGTLDALRAQAAGCTRCALHGPATRTVFGEGPADAALMIVGEQPGDQEDLAGRPFVGPAGEVFDTEAAAAGIDRAKVYVTNAVKHFKFTPRGKRRLHQRPDAGEVSHCRWWLDQERQLLRPRLIVAMGATALAALTGSGTGLMKRRGGIEAAADGTPVLVTVHPSYILRLPDAAARTAAREALRADLSAARRWLETQAV
ncbi:DNA polymerase [Oceanicola sp. 22II-s10i]|uniref:UdgX family uracil-DNA binding protein n=1 Tax=Oceanicola sp. 22II-s10i TaxID=1317116 RepID=UPI000B526817|nr:UdgX family uracil-DNA binding protein [Oceanicola sp. 22II-s10i]OWU85337.1 DNA polymerase [Oceanicola sp. 22II-s10i]